jgi:Mn2+/Fe2+ NRAMP family transporter
MASEVIKKPLLPTATWACWQALAIGSLAFVIASVAISAVGLEP